MGRFASTGINKILVSSLTAIAAITVLIVLQSDTLGASGKETKIAAASMRKGQSGLPLPRFVSLKSKKVNVRQGPGREHRVKWVYARAGFPVEIIQEYDNWRRVRDVRGNEGWVYHSLLSGRRMVQVSDWQAGAYINLHNDANPTSAVNAQLEPGVLASLRQCRKDWCQIGVNGYTGWIRQHLLWGVYPNELY